MHTQFENYKSTRVHDKEISLFCRKNEKITEKTKFSLKIEYILKSGRNEIVMLKGLIGKIDGTGLGSTPKINSWIIEQEKGKFIMVKECSQVNPELILEIEI